MALSEAVPNESVSFVNSLYMEFGKADDASTYGILKMMEISNTMTESLAKKLERQLSNLIFKFNG